MCFGCAVVFEKKSFKDGVCVCVGERERRDDMNIPFSLIQIWLCVVKE